MAAPQFAGNAGPFPTRRGPGGVIQAFSSFGPGQTTTGPEYENIDPEGLFNSERVSRLRWKQSFYKCTQHDSKMCDFDGRMMPKDAIMGVQPLIGGSMPSQYVPLSGRRPSAPYRIARTIVKAFTGLLFGLNRWPQIRSDDPATQDFCEELVRVMRLRTAFPRARNLGGSSGLVGISWSIRDGKPRVRVHPGYTIHALEWLDEEEFLPGYVVELYQFEKDVYDAELKQNVRRRFWHRRDWTPDADIAFLPAEVTKDEVEWQPDPENTITHNDGFCHFVWIPNVPDEEPGEFDGQDDYAELYEQMNSLDILNSVSVKGTTLNLDPTLVLKMEKEDLAGAVLKGSDNAIVTGRQGDAKYMELGEGSVNAGKAQVGAQREQILEVAQCVVPDPNEVVGQGTSSVAMKMMYAPMIGQADILRDMYGELGLVRLLDQICRSVRNAMPDGPDTEVEIEEEVPVKDELGNDTGEFEVVIESALYGLDLAPRIEKTPILGEDGKPNGEFDVTKHPRHPGSGTIELEWGEYFPPTADDKVKSVQGATQAVGGRPVLSQKTGIEIAATLYNRDAQEEQNRIGEEKKAELEQQGGMFPPIGGPVGAEGDLPAGAAPVPAHEVDIGVEARAKITTVNEARGTNGPLKLADGTLDPDGFLTIALYDAKASAMAKAMASVWEAEATAKLEASQPKEPEEPAVPPAPGGTVPPPTQPSGEPPQ